LNCRNTNKGIQLNGVIDTKIYFNTSKTIKKGLKCEIGKQKSLLCNISCGYVLKKSPCPVSSKDLHNLEKITPEDF